MRPVKKNLRKMWYALYTDNAPMYDNDGNPTFEYGEGYSEPVKFRANLSPGASRLEDEPFGVNVQYDRVILLYDMNCPIDEHTRIWIKNKPFTNGEFDADSADYEVAAPPLDSLNVLRIAVKRRVQ